MKRLFFAFVMLVCFAVAFASEPVAEIVFDKTTHDFGTFSDKDAVVSCVFSFKNTGDVPLVINQALASCGCTVPSYTSEPILPGKKGDIKITYNGKGRYPGHFKKIITVTSNAKTRIVRLYIEGNMTSGEEKQ